jgi:hypothetical protein
LGGDTPEAYVMTVDAVSRGGLLASVGGLVLMLCGCGDGGIAAQKAGPASCKGAIPASKAWDHRLENVTVSGAAIQTLSYNDLYGGATIDLADTPTSETGLTVVILDEDRGKFPAVDFYFGKTICVAGLIGGYQPTVMVVSSPDGIAIAP